MQSFTSQFSSFVFIFTVNILARIDGVLLFFLLYPDPDYIRCQRLKRNLKIFVYLNGNGSAITCARTITSRFVWFLFLNYISFIITRKFKSIIQLHVQIISFSLFFGFFCCIYDYMCIWMVSSVNWIVSEKNKTRIERYISGFHEFGTLM